MLHTGDADQAEWITQMLEALGPEDPAKLNPQAATRIKDPHIPAKLYRYRPVNEYSLANLRDDTQWMSAASVYNDPYDSAITVDAEGYLRERLLEQKARNVEVVCTAIDASPDERVLITAAPDPLRALFDVMMRRAPDAGPDAADRLYADAQRFLQNEARTGLQRMSEFMQEGMLACSFAEIGDSPLMWPHYADQHRGFCVEYDFAALPRSHVRRLMLYPVIYGEKRFNATGYFRPIGEAFNNLFGIVACIHKNRSWQYEREWRLVCPFGPQDERGLNVDMPTPSRVYIGVRMPDEAEARVRSIAESKGIAVSRMKLSADGYGLEIE